MKEDRPRGKYFEEFNLGDEFETNARTVTEAHFVAFEGLTGDFNSLHVDAEYCKDTIFNERIAQTFLGLTMVSGLWYMLFLGEKTTIAFLELRNWKILKPIKIGDTIHGTVKIIEKKETKKPDRGIVVSHRKIVNQRGEVVNEGDWVMMVRRKPKE